MKGTRAILAAILAAVLYALMTPLAKLMQVNVGPVAEAGLLYLGAGIGMSAICLCQTGMGIRADRPINNPKTDLPGLSFCSVIPKRTCTTCHFVAQIRLFYLFAPGDIFYSLPAGAI